MISSSASSAVQACRLALRRGVGDKGQDDGNELDVLADELILDPLADVADSRVARIGVL